MLEVEAIPQSCIPYVQIGLSIVLYMRSLLLVESLDFRPSNQYILVRVIPSCFRFAKMCLCQVSLLSRCSPRYFTSSFWGSCSLFIWTGGHEPHGPRRRDASNNSSRAACVFDDTERLYLVVACSICIQTQTGITSCQIKTILMHAAPLSRTGKAAKGSGCHCKVKPCTITIRQKSFPEKSATP
jgi:hypothetical protein